MIKLIETKTLAATQVSVEFTSIPQIYTDLIFTISARSDYGTTTQRSIEFTFNNVSGLSTIMTGDGSADAFANPSNITSYFSVPGTNTTANTFNSLSLYIPNYTLAGDKSLSIDVVGENNGTTARQNIIASKLTTTVAITTLTAQMATGNFVANSSFSLYGVLKGSDGVTTAS